VILTREVAVKYRVDDLSGLAATLAARGIALSAPIHQDDQAYAQNGWRFGMSRRGVAFARLRTQGGRHLFALNRPAGDAPAHVVLAHVGFEAEIADRSQMHEALLQMGFYPTVRVGKVRRTGRLRELALRLDDVEHLGAFLEIERAVPAGWSGAAAQDGIDSFARSLGLAAQPTTDTYDDLIHAALAAV
jgi:adenylate cyclase, class 2